MTANLSPAVLTRRAPTRERVARSKVVGKMELRSGGMGNVEFAVSNDENVGDLISSDDSVHPHTI